MLKHSILTICSFFLVTTSCLAQTVDPAQQLRSFGNEMVEGTWHQEFPDNEESRHTYLWALGNEFLLVYMWHKDKPDALAVVGVDPQTKKQTWWRFRDDGDVHITSVDVHVLSATKERVALSGENAIASGSFEVVRQDSNTLEIIPQPNAKQEGKDAGKEVWKRSAEVDDVSWINAEAPETIPPQMSLARYLTGKKWMDGVTPEGTKFIGSSDGKWILKGKFHIFTGATVMEDQTMWSHLLVMGIDPTTNQPATWEFSSYGAKSEISYDESGMTIYGSNTRSNGDEYSFKGTFFLDGKTLRYQSKIAKEGEEPLPYGWNYRDAE